MSGAGQRQYSSTWLTYAANGSAVTFAVGEEWDWDGDVLNQATNYNITYGRAFRYDGARQRYLHRTLNPSALMTGFITTLGDVWSDYSGDSIYGDYTVDFDGSTSSVTETASRQPGIGMTPWNASGIDPSATEYYNSDMIGSLRAKTDATGSALAGPNLLDPGPVFTAFGEQVGGATERYGYAGAWGYQTDDATVVDKFPFQHVGARYYDPEIGRFLQRDSGGVFGGINCYSYVRNRPTTGVDPFGLSPIELWDGDPLPALGPSSTRRSRCRRTPAPNLTPAQELSRIKRNLAMFGFGATGTWALSKWLPWGWIPAFSGACAGAIDQIRYWDEGVNPVYGG